MKGKLVAFAAILCIASLIASGANAKGKPDKPDKPGQSEVECIKFSGDLRSAGWTILSGCCPNGGPFPTYAMTFDLHYEDGGIAYYGGPYDGELFINGYGTGRNHRYEVQFWNDNLCFEIIGGVIDNDKKNKALTVEFIGEQAYFCETDSDPIFPLVTFTLLRTSDLSECQ